MEKIQHYKSLDVFKFVASLLVVVIHTRPKVGYLATSLCRVSVPFFFVCSSYLFWKKKAGISKYTKRMMMLYLVWSVIYLPYIIRTFFINDAGFLNNLAQFLHAFLFNSTFHASWYLMGAVISMNLVWILRHRFSNSVLLIIGSVLYCLSLLSSSYYGLVNQIGITGWFTTIDQFFVPSNSFIVAFIYVVIGKTLAERQQMSLKVSFIGSLLTIVLGIAEILLTKDLARTTDAFVFLPPFVFFFIQLLLHLSPSIKQNTCRLLRNCSTLIYLFHFICIDFCVSRGMIHGTKLFCVVAAVSLLFALTTVSLSHRFRILKYLY